MSEPLIKQVQFLKENGFTEQQANTLVYFHKDSIDNFLATKKDVLEIRKDIEQLRADTKKDISEVRKEIEQLRADTKKDMEILKHSLTLRLGTIMVGGVAALGTLMTLINQ